jgi:hypothetical protein
MNGDLDILSATIRAHARELAGQELETEHRPLLMQILENAGLATKTHTGSKRPEGTLNLSDREVPTEAIVKALQEQFLLKRVGALTQKLTEQVVKDAARKIADEEAQ